MFVAFDGARRLAAGARLEIVQALRSAQAEGATGPLLAFDLDSGAEVDFDLRGADAEITRRYGEAERARGRPKLGVVAREVTLLPRHWDWLAEQRGGASAAIRRLVEAARRSDEGATAAARSKSAVFRFLSAIAGDFPHFEAASRALFAGDFEAFRVAVAAWPPDIVAVALERLTAPGIDSLSGQLTL